MNVETFVEMVVLLKLIEKLFQKIIITKKCLKYNTKRLLYKNQNFIHIFV